MTRLEERLNAAATDLARQVDATGVNDAVARRVRARRRIHALRAPAAAFVALAFAGGVLAAVRYLPQDRADRPSTSPSVPPSTPPTSPPPAPPVPAGTLAVLALDSSSRLGLYVVPAKGGTARRISRADSISGLSWSPNGTRLVTARGTAEGGGVLVVTRVPSGAEAQIPVDELPQNPVWLPDGSAISFTSGEGNLFLVRSDGAGLRQVTDSGDTCSDVHHAWSPDGSQVAFGRDCTSGGRPGLYVADANGRWAVRVVNKHEAIQGISWSPDGARIAFAPWPQETPGIFSVRPDGSDLLQLTTDLDVQPTWSPDGDEIAFVRDGRIWIMSADGRFSSPIAALRGLHVQALAWTGR